MCCKRNSYGYQQVPLTETDANQQEGLIPQAEPTMTVVDLSELRENLLSDEAN